MRCFLKPDSLSLSPMMLLMLVRSDSCLLLVPTTHCCLSLFWLILPLPSQLFLLYSLSLPYLAMATLALCILCVPYLSDVCLLASVLYSLRGLFVAIPAESCTAARIHQGAHSWEEPVSQNKSLTIHGINGSLSFDASVIERITHEMDYIPSIHWLYLKI